jgi:hypothetical protein
MPQPERGLAGACLLLSALAELSRGAGIELWELLGEQHADDRIVDDDLGIPNGHRQGRTSSETVTSGVATATLP